MVINKTKKSPNFWPESPGIVKNAIVIHRTAGRGIGSLEWILAPQSKVSYHYLIMESGKIYEIVEPKNCAWHAGIIKNPTAEIIDPKLNPNRHTFGIAFAGYETEPLTKEQVLNGCQLIANIARKYQIKIDKKHIIGHNEIRSDKTCPGIEVPVKILRQLVLLFYWSNIIRRQKNPLN